MSAPGVLNAIVQSQKLSATFLSIFKRERSFKFRSRLSPFKEYLRFISNDELYKELPNYKREKKTVKQIINSFI